LSLPDGYRIEPLTDHDRETFVCGKDTLDRYLKNQASQDRKRDLARCFVLVHENQPKRILGYYTLSSAAIKSDTLPEGHRLPYKEIPALILGRLARDVSQRGTGMGSQLMEHVLRECERVAKEIGVHLLIVDALDDEAFAYYQAWSFEPLEGMRLFLTIKDIRATLRALEAREVPVFEQEALETPAKRGKR
jgi:predicted GNAT family N-acyltransferase